MATLVQQEHLRWRQCDTEDATYPKNDLIELHLRQLRQGPGSDAATTLAFTPLGLKSGHGLKVADMSKASARMHQLQGADDVPVGEFLLLEACRRDHYGRPLQARVRRVS